MTLRDATVPAAHDDVAVEDIELDGGKMARLFEGLTGRESIDMKKALGRPFAQALDDQDDEAMFALLWILKRRDDPTLTYDVLVETNTALGMVRELAVVVNDTPDADPINAASGSRSRRSVDTGG